MFKKRIGLRGKGKSGGLRTIIAFKKDEKAFFVYGFAKNQKANIDEAEKKIYKELASLLLSHSDNAIHIAIQNKKLIEVL